MLHHVPKSSDDQQFLYYIQFQASSSEQRLQLENERFEAIELELIEEESVSSASELHAKLAQERLPSGFLLSSMGTVRRKGQLLQPVLNLKMISHSSCSSQMFKLKTAQCPTLHLQRK